MTNHEVFAGTGLCVDSFWKTICFLGISQYLVNYFFGQFCVNNFLVTKMCSLIFKQFVVALEQLQDATNLSFEHIKAQYTIFILLLVKD